MKPLNDGMDIVGYKFDNEKYCVDCFYRKMGNNTCSFSPIRKAVQIQSTWRNCYDCGKNLLDCRHEN